MEKLLILGDGSLIRGILLLPFAVYGFILVVKGAIAYLEKVEDKYPKPKDWQVGLFATVTLFSYLGFFYAVAKLL